ncbi:uncharacterized protein UV8b_07435 [Ustilaginoidea virens]|uniref:Oligonucleotide transporter n=1 Tax=Ustilaginoidea virens TaxID=1159556 RepID=A0A8E5HX28_USTVR|nr:uncharacterized protein UV8b_07435 [Ustilaginoidea virens]QUC23194.1 hypothetical protein UV8b_07435 [Ustilaginoidea virens]
MPVENVLLQSVAGGMAIMPLGCGFVGVIPAMNYLLKSEENGPISLDTTQLIVWSLGLCYFGVVFAVPLRRQVIIRERLKFPSGFSTAILISVLHGQGGQLSEPDELERVSRGGFASLVPRERLQSPLTEESDHDYEPQSDTDSGTAELSDEGVNMSLLLICFFFSGALTILTYFIPILRDIPIFGTVAANKWLWTFNPSLAYVGQGMIMGPETTLHMTLGAIIGWGLLSPLAKHEGWAPGLVDDWEHGSKGWIVWISLAIMLADAVVSLGYVGLQSILLTSMPEHIFSFCGILHRKGRFIFGQESERYSLLHNDDEGSPNQSPSMLSETSQHASDVESDSEIDAPVQQRIGRKQVLVGLVISILLCIGTTHFVFGDLVPLYATVIAVFMAMILSIMGVRALGETDLNPVSGISKLAQLFFAVIIPQSNKSSVLINLVAGAVSEAGALQAGDLMQDLKTGHLLGAAPSAQFWGQIIGATAGAILSAFIYQVYTAVYTIPGDLFQVPTAYVWIFTARLVTGQGLPSMAREWAIAAALIFSITTLLRTVGANKSWRPWIPGGIAVAVGIYNVPSFTLARAAGGIICWYWTSRLRKSSLQLIILASGFILGEGFTSIVNLILRSLEVPHL